MDVLQRIDVSRKELLDLGLRNPLLNHRKRAKQIKIIDELTTEIYRLLVTESRSMTFDALPEISADGSDSPYQGEQDENDESALAPFLNQPDEVSVSDELAARHTDTRLQTNMSAKQLQSRLLSIHNDARTYLEEQGVNVLFIALGFLHWYEAPSSSEARRAPLLLVPVELKRASAQERFKVSYTGDDIGDNLSLKEKLKVEFNVDLPEIGEVDDLDVEKYLSNVANAVKGDERWLVDANEMTLGFFSFGKLLMYKDLDPEVWPESSTAPGFPVLESLLTEGLREEDSQYGDETHIDEIVSPHDVHQVLDADSTQILAILDINAGRNLVLQGPPGTGKSQTITNVIAECVGNGRKVLFVSEKMAALEVVKRRLDQVGLGDAALELHSHKTNKKRVLAELNRVIHQGRPRLEDPRDELDNLVRLRDELNAYCDAVNAPIGNTRCSFVRAVGLRAKNAKFADSAEPFPFDRMCDWSDADYMERRRHVEALDRHLGAAGPPERNPFRASRLTEFLPSQRSKLETQLITARRETDELWTAAIDLAALMGLTRPERRQDVEVICRAAQRAVAAPNLEGLSLSSNNWQSRRIELTALFRAGSKLQTAHDQYDEWLIDEAWHQDLVTERQHLITKGDKWWRMLSGDFRRAKARMAGLARKPLPKDTTETIRMLDVVLDSQKDQATYDELAPLGSSLFGTQWKGRESNWLVLEQLTEWVVALHRDVGEGLIPQGIVKFLSSATKRDQLQLKSDNLEISLESHKNSVKQVSDFLKLQIPEAAQSSWGLTLEQQSKYLTQWLDHIDRLFELVRFNELASDLASRGLEFVVKAGKTWSTGEGTLVGLFDYSWFNGLVEKAYVDSPAIKRFDRMHHGQALDEFARLDHRLFQHNRARLSEMHWQSLPNLGAGGEMRTISREINKKRRHMPIRKLMTEAGRAIQAIKPVFMMSPMSIATYIPPGSVQFDLVLFDEASQVKPVDAFGAIIRGAQTVVVGDSKQLPPTSFFDSIVDGDDEDDFERVGDMESILSFFLGNGAPERMLRWHYRSRHDSLIAVSNNEFYDNKLVVFPSPGVNPSARGLHLHHLPDTAYERGTTRSNPQEARELAEAVLEHAKKHPELTLGVVAFSTAQRDAIEQQLELIRRADSSCESFFREQEQEPFFVKNLENVQGDERDVIFISVGYGKTAEGYMAMSFGPLNRDGGERRLNVLISRARLAMDVFSNFKADDIDLSRTKARGAIALKNFLAFADKRILLQPYGTGKEPDSPFEEEVLAALTSRGFAVEPQVGTAGFFIDIGVRDERQPGKFILGIECDGATYHSSRSARDRDRLRQEVLEGLGWRLHRIWSTDWYRNPERELERAAIAIDKATRDGGAASATASLKSLQRSERKSIQREPDRTAEEQLEADRCLYKRASVAVNLGGADLHELQTEALLPYVQEIVEKESPIHGSEIARRITEGAGLQRAGRRIQAKVDDTLAYGVRSRRIRRKGDFYWRPDMENPPVRDRCELDGSSKKLELVAPEEIAEAIRQVVESGFSMSKDDAVAGAARTLGFQRLSVQSRNLIEAQVANMIRSGKLISKNESISLA